MMPAIEQYLTEHIDCPKEREQRSRRAAKAVSNGAYSLMEMTTTLHKYLTKQPYFETTTIQGYSIVPVDFVAYQRPTAKSIQTKSYSSKHGKAIPAIPFGVVATQGVVRGQRVAIPRGISFPDTNKNDVIEQKKHIYEEIVRCTTNKDIVVCDAGFSLADAISVGVINPVIRLATNKTFGATQGKIPERRSNRGKAPTKHKAEIVRPLARKHKDHLIEATPPSYTTEFTNNDECIIKIEVWENVYFLESHLDNLNEECKEKLRSIPLVVIAVYHPDYENPILLGTPMQEITPENLYRTYTNRWPIEGIPQVGKRILSGGGGRHFTHCRNSNFRIPVFSMLVGVILKVMAAHSPPVSTGFWDKKPKPTFGRLLKQLKKVGIQLSTKLFKKKSQTKHLPIGFEARCLKN